MITTQTLHYQIINHGEAQKLRGLGLLLSGAFDTGFFAYNTANLTISIGGSVQAVWMLALKPTALDGFQNPCLAAYDQDPIDVGPGVAVDLQVTLPPGAVVDSPDGYNSSLLGRTRALNGAQMSETDLPVVWEANFDRSSNEFQPTSSLEIVSSTGGGGRQLRPELLPGFTDAGENDTLVKKNGRPTWSKGSDSGSGIRQFAAMNLMYGFGLEDGRLVYLKQRDSSALGGGLFVWKAGSTATPDGGGIVAPVDGADGRFFRQSHLLGHFTPEDFGALGDNQSDDYSAFMALAAAVNRNRGGQVQMRKDAQYYYGQYIDWKRTDGGPSDEWRDAPIFRLFGSLRVDLNGSTINGYRGGYRPPNRKMFTDSVGTEWWDSSVSAPSGLIFAYGENLEVRDGYLDGQARTWTRWGEGPEEIRASDGYPLRAKHLNETYCCGLQIWSCNNFNIVNVTAKDWLTDGFVVIHSEVYQADGVTPVTNATRLIPHNGHMLNCVSKNNRRQGLSVVAARRFTAINCDFSETGFASFDQGSMTGTLDAYGWHEPGCGIDVEPSTYPTYSLDPNWRTPEMTGDVMFLNCALNHNINGPMSALYSVKVDGGITLLGCTLDARGEAFPDAWIAAACGVVFEACKFWTPKNGFLWLDTGKDIIPENRYSRVLNSRINVTSLLGFFEASRPVDVEVRGNKIILPPTPNPDAPPIYFQDRAVKPPAYAIGSSQMVKFTDNHITVPYALGLRDMANGDVVAQFEGCGQVHGNTWELVGPRPAGLGAYWNLAVLYSTALGGTLGKRFDTKPQGERFIVPAGAPLSDFTQDTPTGFKSLALYTYADPTTSYIPFGQSGATPKGDTTLVSAMIGETAINLTSMEIHGGDVLQPGATLKVLIKRNGTVLASATWATGQFNPGTLTGFPAKMFKGDQLNIVIQHGGTATTYEMGDLVGVVYYQVIIP